jgi:hypothetical protein
VKRFAIAGVLAVVAFGAAALAAAPPAPVPASGAWRIGPEDSQPGPTVNQFSGGFTVASASRVGALHGVTEHDLNRGCDSGVTVTMTGSVPISHFVNAAVSADYYVVSSPKTQFEPVKLTLRGRGTKKHPAKAHKASGELRIFFPGGTDTVGGFTTYSNLTYESATAGTCNLKFSVTAG